MRWVGFALRNFKEFPRAVQRDIGQALYAAQRGEAYPFNQSAEGGGLLSRVIVIHAVWPRVVIQPVEILGVRAIRLAVAVDRKSIQGPSHRQSLADTLGQMHRSKVILVVIGSAGVVRGRDTGCPVPPARIRVCPLGHTALISGVCRQIVC